MSSSAASEGADASLITIPVICGPTASGKSAIAMWLSLRREILVISADSRQIYRGFDLGTAKPSREEQSRVPHRGLDVAEPTERFSAHQWAELAQRAIDEADVAGRIPVVVGGTGFYIGSLFRPLWAQPELDAGRRVALQEELSPLSIDELRRWCETLDPSRAHLGRAQLLRAIEVALLTGERLSDLHVAHARPATYQPSYLLVDPGLELPARIAARATSMLDAGWDDEVRRLIGEVSSDAPAWNATGYDAIRQLVQGRLDRAAALDRVVIETRQYAKRQRTWFRHQLAGSPVQRLVSSAPGWQETVDHWITEIEATMRPSSDRGTAP
ncbi:MAG TPA: tRNA (adenosine(37)-N6)-dimethylallyltransferase MiaA [Gemmatimonadaceae bacterium]|nr:tRNA (adenosine(37)-N6)-dimethylallyltransferase MiaA [Gemmatimonadaceae bacterium]